MAYVIDTNIISEAAKPKPNFETISWLQDHEGEVYLTTVSIMELNYGIMRLPDGKRKAQMREWLDAVTRDLSFAHRIYDLDSFGAYLCAELRCKAEKAGRVPQIADILIAGICQRHNAVLATHNVKDFDYLGIELIDPFEYESPVLAELKRREAEAGAS